MITSMKRGLQHSCSHLPSIPQRPGFPRGLCVLLVDNDSKALAEAQQQLKDCSYCIIPCGSESEAAALLGAADADTVDLVLADISCLLLSTATAANLDVIAAGKSVPLVVMASDGTTEDNAATIQQLGAVDLLQKPLCMIKLRNLWRHTALRLNNFGSRRTANAKADSGCGTNSAGGESGSNASTSERLKPDHLEVDLETTSLDAFALDGANDLDFMPLAFDLTTDLPTDARLETLLGADDLRAMFDACPVNELAESCSFGDFVAASKPNKKGRPSLDDHLAAPWAQPLGRAASMGSMGGHSSAKQSGNRAGPMSPAQPAVGYPAGQLPALPSNIPGMVWGLPTNPLQIVPKPIPAHLGISQHPCASASTAPAAVSIPSPVMSWGPMGPIMMPSSMGGPTMLPPLPGMPSMPPPPGMFGPPGMMMMGAGGPVIPLGPFMAPLPPPFAAPCAGAAPLAAAASMKRSQSTLPMPMHLAGMPPMPGMSPMLLGMSPFPAACDMGPVCAGGVMLPAITAFRELGPPDLMLGSNGSGKSPQRPPLGLQLKKSPSLADLITNHLRCYMWLLYRATC